MALLYVDEHSASLNESEVKSGETLREAEFVVDAGNNTIRRFDPANDALPHGIIVHHAGPLSDALNLHDEDYTQNYADVWKFDGDNDEHAYWQPLASVDQIRPRSQDDTQDGNGNTPTEPSFSEGDIVGVVDINGHTAVVQEGYQFDFDNDNTDETYNDSGGAGDFVSIGRVDKYKQEFRIGNQYDERIPVRLDTDEFQ